MFIGSSSESDGCAVVTLWRRSQLERLNLNLNQTRVKLMARLLRRANTDLTIQSYSSVFYSLRSDHLPHSGIYRIKMATHANLREGKRRDCKFVTAANILR
jgi:hypothetical protein